MYVSVPYALETKTNMIREMNQPTIATGKAEKAYGRAATDGYLGSEKTDDNVFSGNAVLRESRKDS
jgi:hypothetical protein